MKATFLHSILVAQLVAVSSGCSESKTDSTKADSGAPESRGEKSAIDGKPEGRTGLVIDGEHFTTRKVIDKEQGGIAVGVFVAPEKWRDDSQVSWNYEHTSSPVSMSMNVENPANEEAVYGFPALQFFSLRPDAGYYQPGQNIGGLIYTRQNMPSAQTLMGFVQRVRGNLSKFQMVGSRDLPELPAALKLPPLQNQRGVGVKVTYEFNGKSIEEEFYGVYYSVDIPYDGPQGRTWQNNWGVMALHSFRAPAGSLVKRRAVFAAIAKSFRPNPVWQQRLAAINAYLQEQFNRQIQAGYNQIAAAAALSRRISANNDAMIASIDRQMQAARTTSTATGERTAADKFDDYIRGVDTVDDPYYGTSQHSYNEQYHWTDGYGSYRNSNDATYNPNQVENGNWQLMPATR